MPTKQQIDEAAKKYADENGKREYGLVYSTFKAGASFVSAEGGYSKEDLQAFGNIMSELGEVHNMLARTHLNSEIYNPISTKFASAKVQLFNLYNKIKSTHPALEGKEKCIAFAEWVGDRPFPEYSRLTKLWKWYDSSTRLATYSTTEELYKEFLTTNQ